jgi:phosphoenolpyruvate synthase/pyruvate phosphate dikinase
MNIIRNFYASELEEFKVILLTVYSKIYEYQEDRTRRNEIKMREAIQSTIPYLMVFLVIPMTDPDFISAAHLLSGLITDRGGLLCHAAILTNVFNLPCIVECREATQQIKDGDRIQMDSHTGIVMRLMT